MTPRRILVVDDHATDRLKLAMAVKRLGHEAQSVSSGREALDALERELFDLVFLDLLMPGMGGLDVLTALRALGEGEVPPVVVVSSISDQAVIAEALSLGARAHLHKSFGPDELERCIADTLESSAP